VAAALRGKCGAGATEDTADAAARARNHDDVLARTKLPNLRCPAQTAFWRDERGWPLHGALAFNPGGDVDGRTVSALDATPARIMLMDDSDQPVDTPAFPPPSMSRTIWQEAVRPGIRSWSCRAVPDKIREVG